MLGVAPRRYYARQQAQLRAISTETPVWETALVALLERHKCRYGTRRLWVALREKDHCVGRQALRTALARRGLRALQPKAYTPRTTDSTHGLRCAPNRLLDEPRPARANRVWVPDITYLPLASGAWAYLCAFQDVASKLVMGWPHARHHARGTGHHGLAAGKVDPAARSRPGRALRPRRPVWR